MVKIHLAIIDSDSKYSERLRLSFNSKYANSIELYHFDTIESFSSLVGNLKIDVVLVDENYNIDDIPKTTNAVFAYFCSENNVATLRDVKAVSKFQKIEDIYKAILNLYSEKGSADGIKASNGDENGKLIMFASPAGGVGTSALAISYAVRLAKQGKKPLYLNLETFGDSLSYFEKDTTQTFSEIVYAIKSKKAILSVKIQSVVKRSNEGVYYFNPCNLPLDMLEMTESDYEELIKELLSSDEFDNVVVDAGFNLSKTDLFLMKKSSAIVFVSDGSESANAKVKNTVKSLEIFDEQLNTNNLSKSCIFYNKFSSKTSQKIDELDCIGGVGKFENFPISQIVKNISATSELDKIS